MMVLQISSSSCVGRASFTAFRRTPVSVTRVEGPKGRRAAVAAVALSAPWLFC